MRRVVKLHIALLFSSMCFSAGCAGGAQQVVARRAAFDMDCPAESLELTELSECSYGVRGCGKKAAYVVKPGSANDQLCVCAGPCDAVLNLDVTSDGFR
jgi:hypothetical protein